MTDKNKNETTPAGAVELKDEALDTASGGSSSEPLTETVSLIRGKKPGATKRPGFWGDDNGEIPFD